MPGDDCLDREPNCPLLLIVGTSFWNFYFARDPLTCLHLDTFFEVHGPWSCIIPNLEPVLIKGYGIGGLMGDEVSNFFACYCERS